ncbi:hypothetical protein MC3_02140 [Rickettsia slovaca str. D-CWPP]|uniref:Uncharacterized protein n=1 Tax=Rickettsia slovaca str. D-CWPP TaxID=1105109 RepID=H8LP83_RICSL|nr:hypothetical protein MC3_02140 [Rickettsia slovaca str. D-CWPP]
MFNASFTKLGFAFTISTKTETASNLKFSIGSLNNSCSANALGAILGVVFTILTKLLVTKYLLYNFFYLI